MPPTNIQAEVMRLIADHRSPGSQVAGGIALNLNWPRFSEDIDIFHDPDVRLREVAAADAALLQASGFSVEWRYELPTMCSAYVGRGSEITKLDWAQDSAYRFFPPERHPDLGWVLHPFDLATNKALAAAGRREPRDAMDLVEIHEHLYPLSIVFWAAVGKDPGWSPESLSQSIRRFARYRDEELKTVERDPPITAADLAQRLRSALDQAEVFVARMPSEAAGTVFLRDGRIVEPDPDHLDRYERNAGSTGGVWPIPSPADI